LTAYLQTFGWGGVDFIEDNLGEPIGDIQSGLYAERGIMPESHVVESMRQARTGD